jgi:hypothetical protein
MIEDGDTSRTPKFLIPPGYPQVVSIDFNTLLNHGHITPEVLEHLTGLLAALQDSFRNAVPGRPPRSTPPAQAVAYLSEESGELECPEATCVTDCASNFCNADACPDNQCPGHVPIEVPCPSLECAVNYCIDSPCPDFGGCDELGNMSCPTDLPVTLCPDDYDRR